MTINPRRSLLSNALTSSLRLFSLIARVAPLAGVALLAGCAALNAQTAPDAQVVPDVPATHADQSLPDAPDNLEELKEIDFKVLKTIEEDTINPRKSAQRDAAFSFGARSALARRTWQIQQYILSQARHLDKTWPFEFLVIPQKSDFFLVPPIITEATNAVALKEDGRLAASSDRAIKIVQHARIALVSPHWRDYLEREWAAGLAPPPAVLHPKDKSEKKRWDQYLDAGWIEGIKQADEISLSDLARLKRDFTGMILYRSLRASNMISAPYTFLDNKGVVGGGDELFIGERTIRLTGDAGLNPDSTVWVPLEETLSPETLFQEPSPSDMLNGEVLWTMP